jgi:hypothetical protein
MLVEIPGRGQVNLDLPEDITQEELDKLTPEINQKLAALPTTEEAPQEVPAEEAVTEPAQAQQGGLQSWNDYQVASNFDKADFEKKRELFDAWRGKTLQAIEPTGALQTATGRKQLNDQFKQIEKAFQLDRPDRSVLEKYVVNGPELLERGTYGFKRHQLSEATEALEKAAAEKDQTGMEKAASDVKRLNEELSKLPPPKETVGDIFLSKSVLPNFMGAMTEQLSMLVPKIATNADSIIGQTLAGAGIGAGAGAVFGGVGAIPGAVQGAKQGFRTGMATATGKSSYELEYSGTLMGLLSGEIQKDIRAKNIERAKSGKDPLKDPTPGFDGINVNDPEQLIAAMQNEELMGTIKQAANEKGVPVGVVDGLTALATFGLASTFQRSAVKSGLRGVSGLRKVAETGGLFLTEITGGMGGEALSQQVAYGDITDPNAIAMEGALEIGGAVPVVAAAKGTSRADLVSERLRNFAPKTAMALATQDFRYQTNLMSKLVGDEQEQANSPFTFDRGSFDTLHSGLDDAQKEAAFNRAKRLTGMAVKEAYNVLGATPDKPITIKFSDGNNAFSFDPQEESTVQVNLDQLRQELGNIDQVVKGEKGGNAQLAEKRRQTYLISAMAEELIHDTDMTKARANLYQQAINRKEVDPTKTSFNQWRKEFGEKGASQMTEKEVRDTRAQYGDDKLSGNSLYSEFVRQLIQKKKIGIATEDTWRTREKMDEQKKGILEESLVSAKDYWQRAVRGLSKDSPVVREHLKAINSLLDEKQKVEKTFQKGPKKAATTATAAVAPVETEGEGQPQETAAPVEAVQPDAPTEGSEAVPAPLEPEQPSRLATLQAKFDETSNKIAEIEASPVPDEVELEQDRYRQLDALNVVKDNIQKEIEAEKIKAPAPKAKATPAPKPANKATQSKVNPSSLKRFQARGKYGTVRLVFPDQTSADVYDSGRRRDGKDRKKDSATLQKRETTIRNLVAKKILGDPVQASQKLTEYRQMIRDSIVKAEEGEEVDIPSFEAFVGKAKPDAKPVEVSSEPVLSIPEDEETIGAAPITRETPRGQEAAQGQYFNSIDVTVNSKMGEDVNPNADKILDSLINNPEMVNETVKYFAGYIRNNPVFKFELERMGIKTPREVANEALLYLMTASREINFPQNGTFDEQKAAVFRSIKNKLSRLISTELEQKLKKGPTEKAVAPTEEELEQESDPQMEEEVTPQIEASEEEQDLAPMPEDEAEAPTPVMDSMGERENIVSVNQNAGETTTARTASWGDKLGQQVPDTIESQEVPEYSARAFDETGQVILSVEPEILDRISRESRESIGEKLNKIIAETPFSGTEKEIFDSVFQGKLQAKFNPFSQKIEIEGFFEAEKDATRKRNLSSGEKKRRQRARERVEKWMSETLRPSMIKEIGTLRFANASPGILQKLGLKRYRLGDVLGAAKINSEPDTRAIDRLPDFDPYWLGPKGEVIPVESSAIRYEGMDSADSHAGEMIMWLQENEPEIYKDLQQKYGYSLGKNINNEMFTRGWLRMNNDGNNILLEGKPGKDQIDLVIQKAISLELGVVHDRWPAKSKTLFKPLSPQQVSDVVKAMDIFGVAKIAVEPGWQDYYPMALKTENILRQLDNKFANQAGKLLKGITADKDNRVPWASFMSKLSKAVSKEEMEWSSPILAPLVVDGKLPVAEAAKALSYLSKALIKVTLLDEPKPENEALESKTFGDATPQVKKLLARADNFFSNLSHDSETFPITDKNGDKMLELSPSEVVRKLKNLFKPTGNIFARNLMSQTPWLANWDKSYPIKMFYGPIQSEPLGGIFSQVLADAMEVGLKNLAKKQISEENANDPFFDAAKTLDSDLNGSAYPTVTNKYNGVGKQMIDKIFETQEKIADDALFLFDASKNDFKVNPEVGDDSAANSDVRLEYYRKYYETLKALEPEFIKNKNEYGYRLAKFKVGSEIFMVLKDLNDRSDRKSLQDRKNDLRASVRYSQVNPKNELGPETREILVKSPLYSSAYGMDDLYTEGMSTHYGQFTSGKNTIAFGRVYTATNEKNQKGTFVYETQSDLEFDQKKQLVNREEEEGYRDLEEYTDPMEPFSVRLNVARDSDNDPILDKFKFAKGLMNSFNVFIPEFLLYGDEMGGGYTQDFYQEFVDDLQPKPKDFLSLTKEDRPMPVATKDGKDLSPKQKIGKIFTEEEKENMIALAGSLQDNEGNIIFARTDPFTYQYTPTKKIAKKYGISAGNLFSMEMGEIGGEGGMLRKKGDLRLGKDFGFGPAKAAFKLYESFEALTLKNIISDALERGHDFIAITDAPTAAMTEGHDEINAGMQKHYGAGFLTTREDGRQVRKEAGSLHNVAAKLTGDYGTAFNDGPSKKSGQDVTGLQYSLDKFKDSSKLEELTNILGAAKISAAAFRDKSFKSIEKVEDFTERRLSGRGKNILKLAEAFNYKISNPISGAGGWINPQIGLQVEPSIMFTMEETPDAELFAALLASSPFVTPEVQRAIYLFNTNVSNPTHVEHEITFKSREGLNSFIRDAKKLNLGDGFSVDTNTNTMYLGVENNNEQTESNVRKFYEQYQKQIKEARVEPGRVEIIEEASYPELLKQLGGKIQDLPDDFSKGLAGYHIRASGSALGRESIGRENSPDSNWRIKGWSKAQSSERLLRQAKAVSSNGPIMTNHIWIPVRKERATKVAEAYENLPDFDPSESVKYAYESLASELKRQWKYASEEMGIRFKPWTEKGQPYKNASEMRKDVRTNKRLFYMQIKDAHPYLGERDENQVSLNEKLRALHHLFGHTAEGYGFGPRGQENAWIKHSQMFTQSAQRALTTETRGQNSWADFGPHRYSLLKSDIKSEKGTAPYAKQKVAILPEEFTRWHRIPEIEAVLLGKNIGKGGAPAYDPITGKRLPGMTAEEIELIPEMVYPEKKLNYSGVKKDDQEYLAEQKRLEQIRTNQPAPWEVDDMNEWASAESRWAKAEEYFAMRKAAKEAKRNSRTLGAASPSQGFLKSVAGFNFPLRRMNGFQKMSFARKMESENYWTDVNEKNRTLQNVISDFSVFENNTAVLDFWNDLLGSFSASPKESFQTNLLRAINASSENKDRVLAATASMFKVPLMRTKAGEAFVMMPGVGGNLALMESNGKFTYVETAKLNPDEGYMAANRLDANKFASGRLPQVPKNGTAERVLFDDAYKKLAEAYRYNGSPEILKDAASFVAKYVPSEDLVRFLQTANGATFEDAKEIVYGDRLHAARITPIEPSEMELTEIGATTFNPENPVSGLMTAKGALIEGGTFDSISETELFSKKDLSNFKKNWLQIEVSDAGLRVAGPKEPTDEQQMQLAKVVGYAKKPVFLNGKAFDYKKAIRKNAFIDSFVRQIEESYLEADDQIDENGNYRVGLLDNPDFRRRNYDLFKQIEKFRNSTEAFNDTMEKVFADFQEEGLDRGTFDRLRTIFKGDSVPALTAVLTHEVFPSISPASRDFIASRLPYFLKATPNSEVLNLVTKLKEFKDWFGNSKVTRPDGSPAVQYYVATSDIRAPNTLGTPGGAVTYSRDQVRADDVQFSVAQAYQKDGKPRMKTPVFVRAENPLRMASVPEHVFDGSVFIKEAIVPMLSKAIADQTGMKLSEVSERIKTTADAIEEQSYPYLADSTAFANTFFQGVLKGFGFDSIELGEANADDKAQNSRFVVFNADQLKLANGLNSDFTSSPDILGAASIGGFKYQPENKFLFDESKVPFLPRFAQELLGKYVTNADRILGLRRFWQDKFIDLKKIQESIEKQIGEPLPDSLNAYQLEELYHGKVGARLNDFNENVVNPILEKLRSSGISTAEIEEFMYALHAKERNVRIRLINPMPPEPYFPGEDATPDELARYNKAKENKNYIEKLHERGSGISDSEADDLIAKYKADDRAPQFEEARQMLRQMIDGALQQRLDEGLISRPLFEALTDRYKDYVPLKGIAGATAEEVAKSGQATGKGFNIRGEEVKAALGRISRPKNILAYAMNSAAAGIVRAEKNVLGNAIYELVQTYPDSDLWEIAKPETIRRLVTRKDPESGEAFQYARDFIDPTWMNQDDIFATKINGETKFIRIKNPDLVRNLKNGGINSENWSSKVVGALAKFNRLLSLTRTGLSPEFFFTNPIRDLQTAAFNLSAEQYKDLSARVVKSVVSLKPLRTSLAEEFNPNSTQDEWGDSYRAFLKSGGKLIGWVTGDIETQIKDIQKIVDEKEPNSGTKFLRASADWVEKMNGGVENATRLAVFHHARELGATDQQAAAIARNATVNFTKKGEAGPVFNSIYLFFNASLQGSARLVQSVATSKKVQALAGGAIASGLLASMFNEALGGDDEDGESFWAKVPEFKKRTNIIVMLPGTKGKYLALPLPYGYNTFWHTGNIFSDLILGKKTKQGTALRMAETVLESFNPIGGARNLLSSISPTVFQPVVDFYLNEDWAGRPIMPSDFPGDPSPSPRSEKYFNSVSPVSKGITDKLNEITGGNEVRGGWGSMSPEVIDYTASYLFGAVGSTILRLTSLAGKARDPNEDIGVNDIPILRRFVGEQPSYADYERFTAIREAAYTAIEEQKMLRSRGDTKGAQQASEKYASEISVFPIVKTASGQLQKVKQQIKSLQKESEDSGKDNSSKMKALRDRQRDIIMNVSKAYNDALERQKN